MHYFKYLGNKESARRLWENKEALDKYLKRLRELMCEKIHELAPEYVEIMPKELEPGKLYISKKILGSPAFMRLWLRWRYGNAFNSRAMVIG